MTKNALWRFCALGMLRFGNRTAFGRGWIQHRITRRHHFAVSGHAARHSQHRITSPHTFYRLAEVFRLDTCRANTPPHLPHYPRSLPYLTPPTCTHHTTPRLVPPHLHATLPHTLYLLLYTVPLHVWWRVLCFCSYTQHIYYPHSLSKTFLAVGLVTGIFLPHHTVFDMSQRGKMPLNTTFDGGSHTGVARHVLSRQCRVCRLGRQAGRGHSLPSVLQIPAEILHWI